MRGEYSMPVVNQDFTHKLFFVHITRVIPRAGVMIPGARVQDGLGFTSSRLTLHWNLHNIVEQHTLSITDNPDIVIIEPASAILSECIGGYTEDVMTLGPHRLSSEAIVMVPVDKYDLALNDLSDMGNRLVRYENKEMLLSLMSDLIQRSGFSIVTSQDQRPDNFSDIISTVKYLPNFYNGFSASLTSKQVLKSFYDQVIEDNSKFLNYHNKLELKELFATLKERLEISIDARKIIQKRASIIVCIIILDLMFQGFDMDVIRRSLTNIEVGSYSLLKKIGEVSDDLYTDDGHGQTTFWLFEFSHKFIGFMLANNFLMNQADFTSLLEVIVAISIFNKRVIALKLSHNKDAMEFMLSRIDELSKFTSEFYTLAKSQGLDHNYYIESIRISARQERSMSASRADQYIFKPDNHLQNPHNRFLPYYSYLETLASKAREGDLSAQKEHDCLGGLIISRCHI